MVYGPYDCLPAPVYVYVLDYHFLLCSSPVTNEHVKLGTEKFQ
jgi:hypothetical protein